MASIQDTFKDIFLAGVGALAIGAEKSQDLVNQLVEKGQITVEQGKEMTSKLKDQAAESSTDIRNSIIKAHLQSMDKEQRDEFAAMVADMASQVDAEEQLKKEEDEEIVAAENNQ